MKITIDIPAVEECSISDCAYNMNDKCHAKAITIGDGMHPGCDTSFMKSEKHAKNTTIMAGVGACKVAACSFNSDFECSANSITVGMKDDSINCLTFSAA